MTVVREAWKTWAACVAGAASISHANASSQHAPGILEDAPYAVISPDFPAPDWVSHSIIQLRELEAMLPALDPRVCAQASNITRAPYLTSIRTAGSINCNPPDLWELTPHHPACREATIAPSPLPAILQLQQPLASVIPLPIHPETPFFNAPIQPPATPTTPAIIGLTTR